MNKHTPGLWYSDTFEGITIFHDVKDRRYPICRIEPIDDGETEANARLIAAAPELLSALKGMVNEWYQSGQDTIEWSKGPTKIRAARIKAAKMAIVKAEVK